MADSALVVSTASLNRAFLFTLYVSVCFVSYHWLFPRLTLSAKRLAGIMLALQIVVVALSQEVQTDVWFVSLMWELRHEWNIPATLATIQLAVVGSVALVTTRLIPRPRRILRQFYLLGIASFFLYLALDEFFLIHEGIYKWEIYYSVIGVVIAVATIALAAHSERPAWIWHFCLLLGLAMGVAGAIFFEFLPPACDNFAFFRLNECLKFFVWEESLEFMGVWLALVALLGHFSAAVPQPRPRVRFFLYALPALWYLLILFNALIPRLEVKLLASPISLRVESGVSLQGYTINNSERSSRLRLYASAKQRDYIGLGYSVHLVDQVSGRSVASHDAWEDRQHGIWLLGPDYMPVYRQQVEVTISPETPRNRALWIALSFWREQYGK